MQKKEIKPTISQQQTKQTTQKSANPQTSQNSNPNNTKAKPNQEEINKTQQKNQSQQSNQDQVSKKCFNAKYVTINIQYHKTTQLKQVNKELEDILQIKTGKIKLVLDTRFENDAVLLNFSSTLTNIAPKINYLKWIIKGGFTDTGGAKSIGHAISNFQNILQTEFADWGAFSLATSFQKLQNLHILKINIQEMKGKKVKKISEIGQNKMSSAISAIQNIEYVDYNGMDWEDLSYPKNISNFEFKIHSVTINQPKSLIQFLENIYYQIGEMKNRIVDLYITNSTYPIECCGAGCSCCQIDCIDTQSYINAIVHFIKNCMDLPYLTKFGDHMNLYDDERNHYIINDDIKQNKQYSQYKSFITNLTNQKLSNILKIQAFKQNFIDSLSINPSMVFSDLLID